MSPRRYQLGARAAATSHTRAEWSTARELFVEGGFSRASMDGVARRADVGRATLYQHFKSKLDVLEAVLGDFERRAPLDALAAVAESNPPSELLRAVVTCACSHWAIDPTLARAVVGRAACRPGVGRCSTTTTPHGSSCCGESTIASWAGGFSARGAQWSAPSTSSGW